MVRARTMTSVLVPILLVFSFFVATAQGVPHLDVPEPRFAFEPVFEGEVVTHDFVIRNSGTETLHITQIKAG